METEKDKTLFTDRLTAMLTGLAESLNYSLPPARLAAYLVALDGISEIRLKFACVEALKSFKFFPQAAELRELAFRWVPPTEAKPDAVYRDIKPPDWQGIGKKHGFTEAEVTEMLEAGHQKWRDHVAKLAADPDWQKLYEQFGKPGLSQRPSRTWESEEAKRQWASDTAQSQGWAK